MVEIGLTNKVGLHCRVSRPRVMDCVLLVGSGQGRKMWPGPWLLRKLTNCHKPHCPSLKAEMRVYHSGELKQPLRTIGWSLCTHMGSFLRQITEIKVIKVKHLIY